MAMISQAYEVAKKIALEEFGTLSGVTISLNIDEKTGKISYFLSR